MLKRQFDINNYVSV